MAKNKGGWVYSTVVLWSWSYKGEYVLQLHITDRARGQIEKKKKKFLTIKYDEFRDQPSVGYKVERETLQACRLEVYLV